MKEETDLPDFAADVDLRFVSGNNGCWRFNFRNYTRKNYSKIYTAEIATNGSLGIISSEIWDEQKTDNILFQEIAPSFRKGNVTNHLKVIAKGPQIAVFINEELAALITDPNYAPKNAGGKFSLGISSKSNIPIRAQIDNLKIWDIAKL